MPYTLGNRSKRNLENVHPKLVEVVELAIKKTGQDFTVVEGLRTIEKQKEYLAKGTSKTMNSKHLAQKDGYSHAVDLYPYYDGSVQVHAPWVKWVNISDAMKAAALELGVQITWGGDWKSFVDGPHYQLEV